MRNIENTAVNELVTRATDDPTLDPARAPLEDSRVGGAHAFAVALDGYIAESPTWSKATARAWRRPASPRRLHAQMSPADRERIVPTFHVRRRSELRVVLGRLVLPIALLIGAGVVIGAFVGFSGDRRVAPRPVAAAVATTAAPPVAAAPVEPPVVTPAPAAIVAPAPPTLVDVRIESTPSGATVMLVDRGRTQLVGDTPVDAAVDPSREYDLVFTYADGPPHIEHLDARSTRRIAAVLDPGDERPARAPRRAGSAARPSRRAEPGTGTLMISSKPPCEIAIDGRPTGLTTPQRAIPLAAGSHRVTLRNTEKSIRKTLTVQITANATEKVIADLME